MNAMRYPSLQALAQYRTVLTLDDILQGIRREYAEFAGLTRLVRDSASTCVFRRWASRVATQAKGA